MSQTAKDLLIIYETEANQWASYLLSVFTGPISEASICCYDISTVSSQQDDFLRLSRYTCKLLILSKGLLESLSQLHCIFLARVLVPASQVVVLLCGVDSLTPLLELLPLDGKQFLQISSDQDAPEYLSAVTDIIRKGASATSANVRPVTHKPSGSQQRAKQLLSSKSSKSSVDLFVLLKSQTVDSDCELEFSNGDHCLRVRPVCWNERILCVGAPDFPAGSVSVTVYSGRKSLCNAQLQYYTNMEELTRLLSKVTDPVDFMCQAFQVSSADMVDKKLSSMLLERMPAGGFEALKTGNTYKQDLPSLLHFAARYGFRGVSGLLLQFPGAERALRAADRHGQIPTEIAKSHGHTELHVLLRETLKMLNPSEANADHDVYEMMGNADVQKQEQGEGSEAEEEEEDDLYTPLEAEDNANSENAVVIANRPPAPAPRPECTQMKDSNVPFIAQVFQKKKKKIQSVDRDLYSLPTKQAVQEGSIPPTYDSFVMHKLRTTMKLREKVRRPRLKLLAEAAAPVRGAQMEEHKSPSISASVSSREYDDSVYDRIQITQPKPVMEKEKKKKPV